MKNETTATPFNTPIVDVGEPRESWISGVVTVGIRQFGFDAKLEDPSWPGDREMGHITKLFVSRRNRTYCISYEQGWNIRPTTPTEKKVLAAIVEKIGH